MVDSTNYAAGDSEEDDLSERILEEGEEIAYQDWDSGGPGAGAGRVSVYVFRGLYYGFHDTGMEGPFHTARAAIDALGIDHVNEATVEIWHRNKGVTWSKPRLQ